MKISYDIKIARQNLVNLKQNKTKIALIIKHQLLTHSVRKSISQVFSKDQIYTNADSEFVNIYNDKNHIVVDAFDKREGITIEEAFLTGYSTLYKKYFKGLDNPFTIEVKIAKETQDTYVVKEGFLKFGGFTNCEPVCVNTDYTVFKKDVPRKKNSIILRPDYYTLIKLADKKLL